MQRHLFARVTPDAATLAVTATAALSLLLGLPSLTVGSNLDNTSNTLVQPHDPALAGNGIDQSLCFGDVLYGDLAGSIDDVLVGGLGIDVLLGGLGSERSAPLARGVDRRDRRRAVPSDGVHVDGLRRAESARSRPTDRIAR